MILNSEQAIIGAILLNPKILPRVQQRIKPTDFLSEKNATIYRAIKNLAKNGYAVEPSAVLSEAPELSDYLVGIVQDVVTSAGWEYHAKRMVEIRTRHNLSDIADRIKGHLEDKASSA